MKKATLLLIAVIALSAGIITSRMMYDSKLVKLESGLWFGDQAKTLPDFQLTDHDNHAFGKSELIGKWSLMFFGYTHCPDVCPISLQVLANILNTIDSSNMEHPLQVLFVSVDPDRDTPAILKTYVQYFHPDIIGASAPLGDLNPLTDAIGIAHSYDITHNHDTSHNDNTSHNHDNNTGDQAPYEVSHSSPILLVNPEGEFSGLFRAPFDNQIMVRDLSRIMKLL